MNIFWLDIDATRCAQAHQDAHTGAGLKEIAQCLCTAFPIPMRVFDLKLTPWTDLSPAGRIAIDALPYSRTRSQENNPIALWVRASRANFDRAIELAEALAAEYPAIRPS